MVYTKARLEHALKVFRQTAKDRQLRGLNDAYLGQHLTHRLRATNKSLRSRTFLNFIETQDDSDEDEYCPVEDRRRSMAASKKKKKDANLKRKAVETTEDQGIVKKRKGEEILRRDDSVKLVILKLITQKAKNKLEELSRGLRIRPVYSDRISAGVKRRSNDWRSSDGGRRKRPRSRFESMQDDELGDADGVVDVDWDENVDDVRSDHDLPVRTALRSGRTRKRPENTFVDGNKKSDFILLPEEVDDITGTRQHNPMPSVPPAISRSITSIGSSSNQPILIDTSEEEDRSEVNKPIKKIEDKIRAVQIKREQESLRLDTSQVNRSITPRPQNNQSQFRHEPERIEFQTAFIHPILFTLIPGKDTPRCDFCTDWTMGVLGHGQLTAFAVPSNPQNPKQYTIESPTYEKRPRTKMCVKCSLNRLLIMRCHDPRNQSANRSFRNDSSPRFTRIRNRNLTDSELAEYTTGQAGLFPKSRGKPGFTPSRQGPVPSCSFCPHPATWKCCRWQERDQRMRPCQVPNPARRVAAAINSVVVSSSSISIRGESPSSNTQHLKSNISTDPRRQQTQPETISLLDSSSDESDVTHKFATPNKSASSKTASGGTSLNRTPKIEEHSSNVETNSRSNAIPFHPLRTTTTTTTTPLQAPLRGCGLHLCTQCHEFLTDPAKQCNGLLVRSKVLQYLKEKQHGKRADAEWLFPGSLLERGVNDGVRLEGRRAGGR